MQKKTNYNKRPEKNPVNRRRKMGLFLAQSQLREYQLAVQKNTKVPFSTKTKQEVYPLQIKRLEKEIAIISSRIVM